MVSFGSHSIFFLFFKIGWPHTGEEVTATSRAAPAAVPHVLSMKHRHWRVLWVPAHEPSRDSLRSVHAGVHSCRWTRSWLWAADLSSSLFMFSASNSNFVTSGDRKGRETQKGDWSLTEDFKVSEPEEVVLTSKEEKEKGFSLWKQE